MDKIEDLQKMFQHDINTVKRGGRAIRIRQAVENLADDIGLYTLPTDGILNILNLTIGNVTKNHLKTVIKRTWRVEVDESGEEWVRVDRPLMK